MMILAKRILTIILFSTLFLSCGAKKEVEDESKYNDDRVIVRTPFHTLTMGELNRKYKGIKFENLQDEYKKKKRHLELSVERFLHLEAAKEAGITCEIDSSTIRGFLNQQLYKQDAKISTEISDSEVREYFDKYGGEIQFGLLVSRDSALIDSLYGELEKGADWDKLVLEHSEMKMGNKRGGSLGYVPYGRYDEQIQGMAYELDYGEYSKPFRSKFGWNIVKLFDWIKHSDEDLEREWKRYKKIALKYNQVIETDRYKERVMEEYNYKINWDAIDLMAQVSDSIRNVGDLPDDMPGSAYLQYNGFTPEMLKRKIVSYTGGGITIREYIGFMESYDPYRTPDLKDRFAMEKLLEKYARERILLDRALTLKVDTLQAYKDALKNYEENWLIQEFNKQVTIKTDPPTDEDIQKYYDEHPDDFFRPDQVRVFAISLKTEKEAQEILQRLKSGANFIAMAKKYSTDKKTGSQGGDLNFFTVKRFTEIYKAAEGLDIGQLGGPVKMYGNYWVFTVVDRLTRERRPIKLVRGDISSKINADRWIKAVRDQVNKEKENSEYFIDFDLLRKELGITEDDTLGDGANAGESE